MIDAHGDRSLRFTREEQAYLARAEGQAPPRNNRQPAFPDVPPGAVLISAALFLILLFALFHGCTRSSPARQEQHSIATAPVLPPEPPVNITGIIYPICLGDIRFVRAPEIYVLPSSLPPPPEAPIPPPQAATANDQPVMRNDQTVPCKDVQNFAERPTEVERQHQETDAPVPVGAVLGPEITIEVESKIEPPTDPPVKKHRSFLGKLNPFHYVGRAVRKVLKPFRSHNRAEQELRELPGNQSKETRR